MMKRLFFLSTLFIVMYSCKKESAEKPSNLIPEATMENLLYELAILNGAKGFSGGKSDEKYRLPEGYLYDKYGIDSAQFSASNSYYASHPEVYIAIYKRVEERLTIAKKQAETSKKQRDSIDNTRKQQKRDSLKRSQPKDTIKRDTT